MSSKLQHESPAEFLYQWLAENKLQSIGWVGDFSTRPSALSEQVDIMDFNHLKPWQSTEKGSQAQAVVFSGVLETQPKEEATRALAGFRNNLFEAILVFVDIQTADSWSEADFFGLGFKKIAEFPHPEHALVAFEYNLRRYNHKRLWNNPKYWANPENFGKYWW